MAVAAPQEGQKRAFGASSPEQAWQARIAAILARRLRTAACVLVSRVNLTRTWTTSPTPSSAPPSPSSRCATVRRPAPRRLFLAAGVVASNFPDADLLYVGITPPPLGYLLHHRGHTHTLVGLLAQAGLLALLCHLLPATRRLAAADRTRLLALIPVSLAGHLPMDASNTYGVHPFHPFDSRWYYGDAVFIFEPWLWIVLGAAAAANARGRLKRAGLVALVLIPLILVFSVDVVSAGTLAALVATGLVLARAGRSLSPRARAAAALAASALFVAVMFGLSRVAEARAIDLLGPRGRDRSTSSSTRTPAPPSAGP